MGKTTINGVDYRDFPYMEQIKKNINEIINYLNGTKDDSHRLKVTVQSVQPDTSNHTMD